MQEKLSSDLLRRIEFSFDLIELKINLLRVCEENLYPISVGISVPFKSVLVDEIQLMEAFSLQSII